MDLLFVLVVIAVLFAIGYGILRLLRLSQRGSVRQIEASVAYTVGDKDETGDMVTFVFTSYAGYVLWMNQTTVTYRVPRLSALPLLRRLLRLNLTHGLCGPGLVFVPFLTIAEYWSRKREIERAP
jgi:hypothetical protein